MKATLWFLALFGVAVAIALFAGNNQGTVTLFWPPWRVDLSLNLVLLLLAGCFLTLHVALRAHVGIVCHAPQARRWRLQHKERAMHAALLDALSHLVAGRYVRARKAAELVLARTASANGGRSAALLGSAARPGAFAGRRKCSGIAGQGGARETFSPGFGAS
jgi:HemY protein